MGDQEWHIPSQDLFKMIEETKKEFSELRSEMKETRVMIKKYNGLREEVGEYRKEVDKEINKIKEQLDVLQAKAEGRLSVWEGIRNWGSWIVGIAGFCFGVFEFLTKH